MSDKIRETIIQSVYRVWDNVSERWERYSFWNKASDTEMNDGTTVEDRINSIDKNYTSVTEEISNINNNIDEINTNVTTLSSDLSTLKSDTATEIETIKTDISKNTSDIETINTFIGETDISAIGSTITDAIANTNNATQINEKAIQTNAENIQANSELIKANTSAIQINTDNIATNKENIDVNAKNIQTNTTSIENINKTIGTTDITEIGDGTIKGAIYSINKNGGSSSGGGIAPSNITNFLAQSSYDFTTQKVNVIITGTLPSDTIIEGQTLCTVEGCVIRRSEETHPTTETDGDLVVDYVLDTTDNNPDYNLNIVDSDVEENKTYYYSAFPYSLQKVYNRSYVNRSSVTVIKYEYYYGYDLDTTNSSPSARVTYPSDVDNADFTPAAMNYTAGTFNYGSWNSEVGKGFMPRPCMLNYDGTVYEYLNPNDYTKNVDGSASQVASTSFGGNAMIEWGKIYTKRWEENGVYHFRVSDQKLDEDYDCWCNYDRKDNVIEHFYTPIFNGSNVSSKMRSISGQSNYVSATAQTMVSLAQANGDDWYIECIADRWLITDLLVMMARTTDTQTAYGTGRCNQSSAIGQGTMNTKGMFWGSSAYTNGVKVFGMENQWGNIWRRCAGWICVSGTQKVKITRGTHDGSAATDFNFDGTNYLTISDATPSGTSGGYITACKTEKFGRLPYKTGGSSTTYEADGFIYSTGQVSYALVCGNYDHANAICGLFYTGLYHLASKNVLYISAAISCKPCAETLI